MEIVGIIVALFIALLLMWLATRVATNSRIVIGVIILIALVFAWVAGVVTGKVSSHLPNVEGLCRGSLEFSWETEDYIVDEFRDELHDHANCDAPIGKEEKPPSFLK